MIGIAPERTAPDSPSPGRDLGVDLAKAVAILLVLAGHLTLFAYDSSGPSLTSRAMHLLVDGSYAWVIPTAVPTFFLVSSILYLRSRSRGPALARRAKRTGLALLAWMAVQFALVAAYTRSLPEVTWLTLRVGGPTFDGRGAPALYFLVDLMLLYVVLEGLARVRAAWGEGAARRLGAFVVTCYAIAFLALPVVGVRSVMLWSFWPFAVYPFLAVLLDSGVPRSRLAVASACVYVAAIAWELLLTTRLPGFELVSLGALYYARLPLTAGAALVYLAAGELAGRAARALTSFSRLGTWTLGVFIVHPYFIFFLKPILKPLRIVAPGGTLLLDLSLAVAVVALTAVVVFALARTPLKFMVK
ncbi:MAG TPA: acyltransferase [Coriobacteriia bacterium]|jgi:surface polysaccharide O-acyltransferase-like enzyme